MAERKRRIRLVVRTQPSQGWCTGSIPVCAARAFSLCTFAEYLSTFANKRNQTEIAGKPLILRYLQIAIR